MSTPLGLSKRKEAVFALVATVLALALLELGARLVEVWLPPVPVDATLGFDGETRLFVPSKDARGEMITNPNKLSNFHLQHFSRKKASGTFRVVALGESSVYLAEPELRILRDHLEDALANDYRQTEVINAGGLSYGSHRLAILIRELVEYDPDLVLIYMGHNEFEEVEQLNLARPSKRLMPILRVAEHVALFRLARDVAVRFDRARLEEAHAKRLLAKSKPDFGRSATHHFTLEDVAHRMDAFRANLGFILETCRQKDIPAVVGTVPSNLVKPLLVDEEDVRRYRAATDLFAQGRYEEGLAVAHDVLRTAARRHQSSDLENGIIRRLSDDLGVNLADVERAVADHEPHGVPGYRLFLDHCHLNPDGNRIWRLTYEHALASLLKPAHAAASQKLARRSEMELQSLPAPRAPETAVNE